MQSLAMPLRHHEDFARSTIYDIVSSQLGRPAGALAGGRGRGGPARKRNTRHDAHRCVTYRRKRLNMVPALDGVTSRREFPPLPPVRLPPLTRHSPGDTTHE